ncbi:MAG TPA: phosphatase PAP2-related protein [Ignavibacteriaceae bacterium]|nr:phosphatase PAP2-related protein [Ignavibacteriaceae bacterium]
MSWKSFLKDKKNLTEFVITAIVVTAVIIAFSHFLHFVEQRDGVVLNDPLLNAFNPIDLTWLTFALIYLSLIIFVVTTFNKPDKLLIAFQAYGLLLIFRTIAMYLTPFEAPETIILLDDPFVQFFAKGDILTKDLFFSGHTGTLFLVFLLAENKTLKTIFLILTILVGSAVLLQHVHYSIDVFVAPFVAYGAYRIIKKLHIKISKETEQ